MTSMSLLVGRTVVVSSLQKVANVCGISFGFTLFVKVFRDRNTLCKWDMPTCDPLKDIMDNPILIAFIWMGKSIKIQRVNNYAHTVIFKVGGITIFYPTNKYELCHEKTHRNNSAHLTSALGSSTQSNQRL